MSNELLAKIRAQRQFKITVGRFTFLARRPTESDIAALGRSGTLEEDDRFAMDFVYGWEGVTENDVVGGGGSSVVAFDPRLWREWCSDRREFWTPIALKLVEAFQDHRKRLEEAAKNSQPGSN